jgi:hypothetical protein
MGTLNQFAAKIRELADHVEEVVEDGVRHVTAVTFQDLVRATPIDTGAAISNWAVSIGSANPQELSSAYAPGHHGSTYTQNVEVTLREGLEIIEVYSIEYEQPLFIYNASAYIQQLNDGHSRQAPAGFVQAAVYIGRLEAQKIKV